MSCLIEKHYRTKFCQYLVVQHDRFEPKKALFQLLVILKHLLGTSFTEKSIYKAIILKSNNNIGRQSKN